MRIGIVGLGIGGATAAAVMASRGLDVTVFEQASEIREVGAGVATWPNTIRLLNRLGLGPQLAARGSRNDRNPIRNSQGDITQYVRADTYDDALGYYMHRAELLQMIADLVPKEFIRLGQKCVAVDLADDHAIVRLESGQSEAFDVVIGADGIRSAVIDTVTTASQPIYSNLAAYRGLVPNEGAAFLDEGTLFTDRTKYFVTFPVSGGELVNFVGVVPTPGHPDESWFMSGDKAQLEREYRDWAPKVRGIISQVSETFRWGLYYRKPLPRIVNGRVALLGDAAHPMLIHAGQGLGQALEDGVSIAVLLDGAAPGDVEERLRAYQRLRLPRASAVQAMSRRNAQFMHKDFPLEPGEARATGAALVPWIVDYDVQREAEALVSGRPFSLGDQPTQ